jgi:hypothetical protein
VLEAVLLIALVTVVITWASVASGEARRRREAVASRQRGSRAGTGPVGVAGASWAAAEPVPRDVHEDRVRRAGDEGFVDGLIVGHYVWPPREPRDDGDRTHDDRVLVDGDEVWDLDDATGDELDVASGARADGPSTSPGDTSEDGLDDPADDLDDGGNGVAHDGWVDGFDGWDDTDDW